MSVPSNRIMDENDFFKSSQHTWCYLCRHCPGQRWLQNSTDSTMKALRDEIAQLRIRLTYSHWGQNPTNSIQRDGGEVTNVAKDTILSSNRVFYLPVTPFINEAWWIFLQSFFCEMTKTPPRAQAPYPRLPTPRSPFSPPLRSYNFKRRAEGWKKSVGTTEPSPSFTLMTRSYTTPRNESSGMPPR